ncbi:MAG: Zn-ribbon domain-containing OB-fold protein [Acidimicrobiales bacterium]
MRGDFPLPDTAWEPLRPYWDGAARDQLMIPRCGDCRAWVWYPPVEAGAECPTCGSNALGWKPASGRATLFSWVVVRHPFLPQFADQVPYVTGLVALAEAPAVRVATRLVDCSEQELAFELPVEVVFRPLRFTGVEGQVTAPMFRPVRTANGRPEEAADE